LGARRVGEVMNHKHYWQYPGFEDESTHTRYCKTCGVKAVYPRLKDEVNLDNSMPRKKKK
jgi:hypothetical protein